MSNTISAPHNSDTPPRQAAYARRDTAWKNRLPVQRQAQREQTVTHLRRIHSASPPNSMAAPLRMPAGKEYPVAAARALLLDLEGRIDDPRARKQEYPFQKLVDGAAQHAPYRTAGIPIFYPHPEYNQSDGHEHGLSPMYVRYPNTVFQNGVRTAAKARKSSIAFSLPILRLIALSTRISLSGLQKKGRKSPIKICQFSTTSDGIWRRRRPASNRPPTPPCAAPSSRCSMVISAIQHTKSEINRPCSARGYPLPVRYNATAAYW